MALLDRCGNCGGVEVYPGLNTVQCYACGWVTRNDGALIAPDGRFYPTIWDKVQAAKNGGNPDDVPVEGSIRGQADSGQAQVDSVVANGGAVQSQVGI
jgi:hypothetical protein